MQTPSSSIIPAAPDAVYFDTSAIRAFSGGFSDVGFSNLADSAAVMGASLFVPRMVSIELLKFRIAEARDSGDRLRQSASKWKRYTGQEVPLALDSQFEDRVRDLYGREIDEVGIVEIPFVTSTDLAALGHMAAFREPPFEEKGEKGFRDCMVLFSIAEHLRSRKTKTGLLVAADNIFVKPGIERHWAGAALKVVKSCDEARGELDNWLDTAILEIRRSKESNLQAYILQHQEEIFGFVMKNAQVPKRFLQEQGQGYMGYGPTGSRILEILAASPTKIGAVSMPDFGLESFDATTHAIAFEVEVAFRVRQERLSFAALFDEPMIALAAPQAFNNRGQQPLYIDEEAIVLRTLIVKAQVSEAGTRYSNLRLLSVVSS